MKSRTSDRSTAGEQDEPSPKGRGARRKIPSDRQLARLGLKPVEAFVCAALLSGEPEEAGEGEAPPETDAERKRKQRGREEQEGVAEFNVKVPKNDKAVKDTIKAVAESARGDRQLYAAVVGIAADASLRTLVSSVSATPQLLPLMAEIVQRVDVRTLVEAVVADQVFARTLLDFVSAGSLPAEVWAVIVGEINRVAAEGIATRVVAGARPRPLHPRRSSWPRPQCWRSRSPAPHSGRRVLAGPA